MKSSKVALIALAVSIIGCSKNADQAPAARAPGPVNVVSLSKNPDFVSLVAAAKLIDADTAAVYPEFDDGQVTLLETFTLYRKLGFSTPLACQEWFKQINGLTLSIKRNYLNATPDDFKAAYEVFLSRVKAGGRYDSPCTDQVIGSFVQNVTHCAMLGVIPIIGEIAAGTCMCGALINYIGGLNECKTKDGTPIR